MSKKKGKSLPAKAMKQLVDSENDHDEDEESQPVFQQKLKKSSTPPQKIQEQKINSKNKKIEKKQEKIQQLQTKSFSPIYASEEDGPNELPVIEWMIVTDNILKILDVEESSEFSDGRNFDFSGLESATDFMFYQLISFFKKHRNKNSIKFDKIHLNGCKHITVWTLHYLNIVAGKSLFDLKNSPLQLSTRVSGCDLISDSLMISLSPELDPQKRKDLMTKYESKVVIINDYLKNFSVTKMIIGNEKNQKKSSQNFFLYSQLKDSNKSLNIYECSESISDLFLTERSIVILVMDTKYSAEAFRQKIVDSILQIMSKNFLPKKIIILITESDQIQGIKEAALNELENVRNKIMSFVSNFAGLKEEIPFHLQKSLGYSLNLAEQISLLKSEIEFLSIDVDQSNDKLAKLQQNLNQKLDLILADLDQISNEEVEKTKNLKYPSSGLNMVSEAVCILLGRKSSFSNFQKFLDSFIRNDIKEFDHLNLSDYDLKKLNDYIQNNDFTKEKISEASKIGGVLCEWVRVITELSKISTEKMFSMKISDISSLKNMLINNACYSFTWHNYLNQSWSEDKNKIADAIKIQELLGLIDLKRSNLLTIDEFYRSLESNDKLKLLMKNDFASLSDKVLKSYSANGNYLLKSTCSSHVVTNVKWLSDLIESIPLVSVDSNEKNNSLKNDVPILSKQTLTKELSSVVSENKIDDVTNFMEESNLLMRIDAEAFIPMYCLKKDIKQELASEWNDDWKGFQASVTWNLYNSIGTNVFSELLKKCFSLKSSVLLWQNGIMNKECSADILIQKLGSKITLSVRMLNPIIFNIQETDCIETLKYIFMSYYLLVQYILYKQQIPHLLDLEFEKFAHPEFLIKPFFVIELKNMIEIVNYDHKYFSNIQNCKHYFGEQSICQWCFVTNIDQFLSQNKIISEIYPQFSDQNFILHGMNKKNKIFKNALVEISINKDESQSISPDSYMNPETTSCLKIKFLEKDYSKVGVKLSLNYSNETTSLIDLNKRTQKTYDQYKIVKLVRTRLFEFNSAQDKDKIINPIFANDVVSIELINW
ncbi:dynein heavy chain axonemal, partial [Brachionus plicatilis]